MKANNGRIQFNRNGTKQVYCIKHIMDIVWYNKIKLPQNTSDLPKVGKFNEYGYMVEIYPSLHHAAYYGLSTLYNIKRQCDNIEKPKRKGFHYKWVD